MKQTNPKFEIKETSDNQFHFVLKARNGRTILSSETYASRQGAENGINSVIENAQDLTNFEVKIGCNLEEYFILKAGNGETIGISETYKTRVGLNKGLHSVSKNSIEIANR